MRLSPEGRTDRKKYFLLTLDFPPQRGGVARYLETLANFFGDEIVVEAIVDHLPRWWQLFVILLRRQDEARCVLVSHILPAGTAAWMAQWCTHLPYVVFVHGMDIGLVKTHPIRRWLAGRILHAAALVVTNSKALEREVQKDFHVRKTMVIYPCVSVDTTRSIPRHEKRDSSVTLLTVARLVPRKGHPRVLEALHYLLHMKQIGSVRYHIVGDGPMYETILERVRTFGLESVVQIDRYIDDEKLRETYQESDIFVMPTVCDPVDREGFGLVYLEAAAYGVPAIATRQSGVDEAVLDGETGILVPDGDRKALAEAIQRLVTDEALRQRLGEYARERVLREFTCEVQFSNLKSWFQ